jgi:hypothetical protein
MSDETEIATTPAPPAPEPASTEKTPEPKKRGRPPKFDEKIADEFVARVRAGHFFETAANLVGLPVQTMRAWLREGVANPRGKYGPFSSAVKRAKAESEDADLTEMERRAKNANDGAGDWKERAWRLERKDPRKFGPRVTVEFRNLVGEFLDHLEANLDEETFEKVLTAAESFEGEESSTTVDEG